MTELRTNCPMRHRENGNCTVIGGFCTAVNDPICEGLHNAYDVGYREGGIRALGTVEELRALVGGDGPLTLDELREMCRKCEGVYVARTDDFPLFHDQRFCAAVLDFSPAFGTNTLHIHAIYGDRLTLWEDDYGRTWLAYRRKPEEGAI